LFAVAEDALERELLTRTDWFTDELFALSSSVATTVRFPVSRLVLDPERYLDDAIEPMAARGMGVIYTHTSDGRSLRTPPTSSERSALIARYYAPHHKALSSAVARALAECGVCLLLDCHSYPSKPIPSDLDQSSDRPDICLGTDQLHTPAWLLNRIQDLFESHGMTMKIDSPYAGVLVPESYARRDRGVFAIMIEINRSLYINECTGMKHSDFPTTAETIQKVVLDLIAETRKHGTRQVPIARLDDRYSES